MLSLKATVLLGAPLLAAASEVIPSRIQRRAALLELLEHQHDRRAGESYGQPDICKPDVASNDASYLPLAAGGAFADVAYAFAYQSNDPKCVTAGNCQTACIADAATCIGFTYAGGSAPVCTLYGGAAYGGPAITTVPANFFLLQNAGTSEEGAPTCATKGNLDTVNPASGRCTCGAGRHFGESAFVCVADDVPPTAITPPKPLDQPVTFSVEVSWSNSIQAVPAVMTSEQCAATCLNDSSCQAYLLNAPQGAELNSCWKLGAGGVYPSPAGDAPTPSGARLAKRQSGIQLGGPGFTFGQIPGSTLTNDAVTPAPSQRARMMRTKRGHNHSQW